MGSRLVPMSSTDCISYLFVFCGRTAVSQSLAFVCISRLLYNQLRGLSVGLHHHPIRWPCCIFLLPQDLLLFWGTFALGTFLICERHFIKLKCNTMQYYNRSPFAFLT